MFSGSVLLCSCCNLVLKELSFEQRVNSKELAFTWLSRCCYGREARQRKKKPPSLRLSLIPIFILSIYIPPPLLPRSLALPESLAGWKSKWLMRAHSSCSLSPLHFSNKIHSLSPLLSETSPSLFFCPQFGFWFLFFAVCLLFFSSEIQISRFKDGEGGGPQWKNNRNRNRKAVCRMSKFSNNLALISGQLSGVFLVSLCLSEISTSDLCTKITRPV